MAVEHEDYTAHEVRTVKAKARSRAKDLGHTLGRFSAEGTEYAGGTYWLARCKGCLDPAVCSPDRYGARTHGGKAVTSACLSPYVPPTCFECGGRGVVEWTGTEADHGCDGTLDDCARKCPVPVEVLYQGPCPACGGEADGEERD